MILLSTNAGAIYLIDAFQGSQLHTFTVSSLYMYCLKGKCVLLSSESHKYLLKLKLRHVYVLQQ